jgi:hypothetical protein
MPPCMCFYGGSSNLAMHVAESLAQRHETCIDVWLQDELVFLCSRIVVVQKEMLDSHAHCTCRGIRIVSLCPYYFLYELVRGTQGMVAGILQ